MSNRNPRTRTIRRGLARARVKIFKSRAKQALAAAAISVCAAATPIHQENLDYEKYYKPPHYLYIPAYEDLYNQESLKYILLKGGRGSGKSFFAVTKFIDESFDKNFKNCKFVFGREIQKSIDDSVYSVAKSMIEKAELSRFFRITKTKIKNLVTGVEFVFMGFRATGGDTAFSQLNKLKGMFGVKRIFVDEAQDLTEDTINVLFPTVNRGSDVAIIKKEWHKPANDDSFDPETKFIFCMNPNFDNDPIVVKLQGYIDDAKENNLESIASILHVNIFDLPERYQDPQLLEQADSEKDEVYYNHVWLGEPFHKLSGRPWEQLGKIDIDESVENIAFLDPSFAGGDFTALTFLGMQRNGRLVAWGKVWPNSWLTAATAIIDELNRYRPRYFYYEANSLHGAPQKVFGEMGWLAIPHLSLTNKEARIYRVASIVVGKTDLAESRCNREYIKNVRGYTDKAANDDAPDSLASACIKAGVMPEKMKI